MLDFEIVNEHRYRATKRDQRKGWPSLRRPHDAVHYCVVSYKQQLCISFNVIYCLAVGRLESRFKNCVLTLLGEQSLLGRLKHQQGFIPALYLREIDQGTNKANKLKSSFESQNVLNH